MDGRNQVAPHLRKNEFLTAKRLREVLEYDPDTGEFSRKETRARTHLVKWDDPTTVTKAGYLTISVDGTHYNAHRLAWLWVHREWPKAWVHHLNGNRTDNRIANLALKVAKTDLTKELTLERLKEVLNYDPTTGLFIWKIGTARGRPGAQAGVIFGPHGYRYISVDGRKYLAHRLAWFYTYGAWPQQFLDHINRQADDNRIANLREASAAQNAHNAERRVGTSGFKGVRKRGNRYVATVTANNLRITVGRFDTAEEAYNAYLEAAKKYHGSFAPVNHETES